MGRVHTAAFAFLLLGQAAAGFSQTPEEFIRRAQAAPDSNRRVTIYSEALKKYPADARFYHKRGIAYGVMEYHDKAFSDFNQAVSLDPSVPAYYQDRGLALHRLKRNEEAIADFTKLIALEPGNARAYYLRAVSYTNLRQLDKAEPDLDKAVQLDPKLKDDSAVRQIRGLIASKKPIVSAGTKPGPAPSAQPQPPAPVPQVTAPAGTAPGVAPAAPQAAAVNKPELRTAETKVLANKGKVMANLKKYLEAAEAWGKLLALEPAYYPAYAERGYALALAGLLVGVVGVVVERGYLLRGVAWCSLMDFEKAKTDLDKAAQLDPKQKREFAYSSASMAIKMKKPCK